MSVVARRTAVDNESTVLKFFDYLRAMVMSTVKNISDDSEIKEVEYLSNFIKNSVADCLEQREGGKIPLLSLTVYGSRDGHTVPRFQVTRNADIIQSWSLGKLAAMLNRVLDQWDNLSLSQNDAPVDMVQYQAIRHIITHDKK